MTKIVNEKRIYGAWAGNPAGTPEDITRCIQEVLEAGRFYQCGKKRGHSEDGLYCAIHDPEYINTKQLERQAVWDKETAESTAKHKLEFTAVKACKEINPDNPQAVAERIVKAVNSYDAMYEALREAQSYIARNEMQQGRQDRTPLEGKMILALAEGKQQEDMG